MADSSNVSDKLALRVGDLSAWADGVTRLAEMSPERTTMPQMAFFLAAACGDLAGRPTTLTDIKDDVGSIICRSVHSTYALFLDRPRKCRRRGEPQEGLGWLTQETDPLDNRRKFLRLTEAGRAAVARLFEVIDHAGSGESTSRMTISPFDLTLGDAKISIPPIELTISRA